MFKQYVCSIALICALTQVTGCSKATETASESSIDPDVMSGVAATGAPVSSAKVKIKGSDGTIVEDETSTDGSYSVNVATLTEPYLVQVEAPSGEKYISVASKSALAEGKKINVTPLTHTIVANVFEKADADDLFENFQSEASKYSDSKLEGQKVILFNKLVAAGLIGTGGVVDSSVDLLNGVLLAGTSKGIDGLLDVLDINTGATSGIEIKLKGEDAPFITDVVTVANDVLPAPIAPALISGSVTQLSMLDVIRKRMIDFSVLYSSKVACNGAPLDDGGVCDVDSLNSDLTTYFHPNFNEDGLTQTQAVWDWICVNDNDDTRVSSKSECVSSGKVFFEKVVFKDITLIHFNKDTGVALVNFNVYFDGKLEGSEDFHMKIDSADNKFKLLGNKKSFRYWIETESVHRSEYVRTTVADVATSAETNGFEVSLNMWFGSAASHTFSGDEVFEMTSAAGHPIFGGSASKTIYLVKGPSYDNNGVCTEGLVFSTRSNPYLELTYSSEGDEVKTYKTYDQACGVSNNACGCDSGYFDWENQKIAFTATEIALMDKNEKINFTSSSPFIADVFILKRPIIVNSFTAANYMPSIGKTVEEFCNNMSFTEPLNLSVASGKLDQIRLHYGYTNADGTIWDNQTSKQDYWDQSVLSAIFNPTFASIAAGDKAVYANINLSSQDESERKFRRDINCSMQ